MRDGTEAVDYVLGREAFENREQYPSPDLVLLDQRMREMDGSEAARNSKKQIKPDAARLYLQHFKSGKLHELCYSNGAAFCIAKPLDYEILGKKLRLIVEFARSVLELPRKN
ncbi:MAG: hypothetical protein R3E58_11990 [Phycisphaerae bacterium]